MSRSSTILLPQPLRRMLDRYRRRWRAVNFQRGLALVLDLVVAAVGLAVAADRLLRLEPTLRAAALGAIAVLFAAGLGRWVVWPAVRRITDRDAAVRLGRHFPEVEEDLVSAVELSASGEREEGISRSLVLAVLGRIAGRAAATVNHRAAVSLRPLLIALAVFVAVSGAFLAAYLARPEAVENALARLLQPTREVPFFSYTRVSVAPGDQVIRVGDAAQVSVVLSGRLPETALLEGRSGAGAVSAVLRPASGGAEWHSEPLFEDLRFRVLAGDAVSDWHRVRVLPPPALAGKSAVLRDPDYAGGDERAVENIQGPLEIVAGTAVVLRGAPVVRGPDAEFRCEGELVAGGRRLPLAADETGRLCSPRIVPDSSGEYAFLLKDGFGLASRAPDSVFIKVVPDDVPKVNITEPGRDLLLLPGEQVEVAAEAQDEFGLRGLVLCSRAVKGAPAEAAPGAEPAPAAEAESVRWDRRTLKDGGAKVRQLGAKADIGLAAMGLAPGDTVEYRAEASDYAGEAFVRRGTSRLFRVTIMSEAKHRELMMDRLRDLQVELRRRAAEQRAEAGRVGELADAAKDVAPEARSAEGREAALGRSTEALARKFDGLIPEMARNPTIPASMLSEMERLGRAVGSVASGQMASAARSLGEAAAAQPPQQSAPLGQARESEDEAARRLEDLARAAEQLQRSSVLEALAEAADRLAARQRELKESTLKVAPKTAGKDPKDLGEAEQGSLERLAAGQELLKKGTETLAADIERAATALAFSSPTDAETAKEAGGKLESDKVADKMADLQRQDLKNVLFAPLAKHDEIAESLAGVARTLRRSSEGPQMDAVAREIEEFIRRQKEVNGGVEASIAGADKATAPAAHGERQSKLGRDVSEQAHALDWLAQEIENFESATAARLAGAAVEMRQGASDFYATKLPDGLEHGRRALALLEQARAQFPAEAGQMASAAQMRQALEAMILLVELLTGQKQVNRDTAAADESRVRDADAFNRRAAELAGRQSGLRVGARRLEEMIAGLEQAAAIVGRAGEKMDLSRAALADGDTGQDTRVVQREVVALLEQFLKDQQGRMGGMGMAGMRTMAMMQMLARIGMSPGGFTGGTNAPVLPAEIGKTDDEKWRRVRSRFEGRLSEGAEETYPAPFRGLLNAYFDRLREEPPR